jgi:hypothetical protein
VKAVNVQPAGAATPADGSVPGVLTTAAMPRRGGLPTVLNEQLLRITVEVEIVKLLPKN